MKITQFQPIEYVSRTRYNDAFGEKKERNGIIAGAGYIARLVVNPLCERDYAADYFVMVNDVYVPSRTRAAGRLAVTPLTDDGAPEEQARTEVYALHSDGILSNRRRVLSMIDHEKGYLLDNSDGFDQDFAEYLRSDRPRNLLPA